eukprot:TRINITY_DN5883_c0_g1_i2.p1 TRINITY_DN5883_c0_g1~~TRINITY_DN5883_c0_g1_i2.p1  ORF type:complete len:245 (-),score=31.37 TRINITY_DN5883_c0_g1_i2:971-1705(-)
MTTLFQNSLIFLFILTTVASFLVVGAQADPVVFYVTSEGDSGPGTFREAMNLIITNATIVEAVINVVCPVKLIAFNQSDGSGYQFTFSREIALTINGNGCTLTTLLPTGFVNYPRFLIPSSISFNDLTLIGFANTVVNGNQINFNRVSFLNNTGALCLNARAIAASGSTFANNKCDLYLGQCDLSVVISSSTSFNNKGAFLFSSDYMAISCCTMYKGLSICYSLHPYDTLSALLPNAPFRTNFF